MSNVAIVTQLLITLLDRAVDVSKLIRKANAEGRDITDVELNVARLNDDTAKDNLDRAIAATRDN